MMIRTRWRMLVVVVLLAIVSLPVAGLGKELYPGRQSCIS